MSLEYLAGQWFITTACRPHTTGQPCATCWPDTHNHPAPTTLDTPPPPRRTLHPMTEGADTTTDKTKAKAKASKTSSKTEAKTEAKCGHCGQTVTTTQGQNGGQVRAGEHTQPNSDNPCPGTGYPVLTD